MMRAYTTPYQSQSGFQNNQGSMKRRSFSLTRIPDASDSFPATQVLVPPRPPKKSAPPSSTEQSSWETKARSRRPLPGRFHSNPHLLDRHLDVSRSNAEWRSISRNLEGLSLSSSDSMTSVDRDNNGTTVIVQVKSHRTPESQRKSRPRSMNIEKQIRDPNTLKHITGGVKVLPTNLHHNFSKSVPSIPEASRTTRKDFPNFEHELNSVQVFRQPKYKQRFKSKQKIQQIDHLNSSEPCEKQMEFIHDQLQTREYGNMDPVSSFQGPRLPPKPKFKENIYEEVDETLTTEFKRRQKAFMKQREDRKVTFQLPIEALHGPEEIEFKKKIIAVRLYGIAEVVKPLRNSSDEQRRTVARMCYRAVRLKYAAYSLNFLGKVDVSRSGEEVFIILEKDSFEIHDSNGVVIARHRRQDISVITAILDEARVITYIGKCRFSGRVAMVLKFNKSKHVKVLNGFFYPSSSVESSS